MDLIKTSWNNVIVGFLNVCYKRPVPKQEVILDPLNNNLRYTRQTLCCEVVVVVVVVDK
jgi:hypothetical protein